MSKKFSPKTANSNEALCSLRSDNFSTQGHWIIVGDEHVTLCAQVEGENPTGTVTLAKADFNRMLRWYQRPTRHPSAKP